MVRVIAYRLVTGSHRNPAGLQSSVQNRETQQLTRDAGAALSRNAVRVLVSTRAGGIRGPLWGACFPAVPNSVLLASANRDHWHR